YYCARKGLANWAYYFD
nr:immunoglobulin heavy chain junction region [Mus musculus]